MLNKLNCVQTCLLSLKLLYHSNKSCNWQTRCSRGCPTNSLITHWLSQWVSLFLLWRVRESSYAYLWLTNYTILTTIIYTTSIHKGNASSATIITKKTSRLFLPVTYKGEGFSASRRTRELILGSNWGRIQFPIHWCTLQVWFPHQIHTVERSPLSALVTKLVF